MLRKSIAYSQQSAELTNSSCQSMNKQINTVLPPTPAPAQCCLSEAKRRFQLYVGILMTTLCDIPLGTAEQARPEKAVPFRPLQAPLLRDDTIFLRLPTATVGTT